MFSFNELVSYASQNMPVFICGFLCGCFIGFQFHKIFHKPNTAKFHGTYNCTDNKEAIIRMLDNCQVGNIECEHYKNKLFKKHYCTKKNQKCHFFNQIKH
ncbi:hypothetical protein DMB92_05300 [Campylobacter sp. MIT 99-7217]|uniref:hypothetical protein n=1 Tax=Campylobacter sp. MIT 99-7217 TaxID=535091 RepID=UPI00115AD950|nr:hypothetical protein [Campylobacter sp. MIT 99-7217]TQR31805.1 hypothetical protein DMB92_05300 [Campylobacter sp. MIT 99-7217]